MKYTKVGMNDKRAMRLFSDFDAISYEEELDYLSEVDEVNTLLKETIKEARERGDYKFSLKV